MRIVTVFGVSMLIAVLMAGVAAAEDDSVSVNASFTIPSWISLSVVGSGDVGFGEIAGGGGYAANSETQLHVLSTTSWLLSSTILWAQSTMPNGASQSIIESALALAFSTEGGTWGSHTVSVAYQMDVTDAQMAELPVGDYNLVIQYTATTD